MNPIEQNIDSGSAGLRATERNIDSSASSAELHVMEQNIDSGSFKNELNGVPKGSQWRFQSSRDEFDGVPKGS
jgi:hypothetical protein